MPETALHRGRQPSEPIPLTRRELGSIAAFWLMYASLSIAGRVFDRDGGRGANLAETARVALAEALIWIVITPVVFALANRIDSERHRARQILIYALIGAAIAVTVGWFGTELRHAFSTPRVSNAMMRQFDSLARRGNFARRAQANRGPPVWFGVSNALVLYFGVLAAGLARTYSRRYQLRRVEAARREARLGAQLAEARLDALRRQLDPHFLFNTLNTVSALVERDPKGVRRMITRLSELLRHSMEGDSDPENALRAELVMLNRYVEIMQVRFQGRLTVETHIDEALRGALVPTMILQPLVENAIKYGVEQSTDGGRIVIDGSRRGDELVLRITDNGKGITPGDTSSSGGVGLRNTRSRLEQLYGEQQSFTVVPGVAGGTVAEIVLPFHTSPVSERVE